VEAHIASESGRHPGDVAGGLARDDGQADAAPESEHAAWRAGPDRGHGVVVAFDDDDAPTRKYGVLEFPCTARPVGHGDAGTDLRIERRELAGDQRGEHGFALCGLDHDRGLGQQCRDQHRKTEPGNVAGGEMDDEFRSGGMSFAPGCRHHAVERVCAAHLRPDEGVQGMGRVWCKQARDRLGDHCRREAGHRGQRLERLLPPEV
jgi:hypothetical protein